MSRRFLYSRILHPGDLDLRFCDHQYIEYSSLPDQLGMNCQDSCYTDVVIRDVSGGNAGDLKTIATKALNMAVKASLKLKDELYTGSFVESAFDVMAIEDMMKREGLLLAFLMY